MLGIGSNLGDRRRHLTDAVARVAAIEGVDVVTVSTTIETQPVGGPPQGDYLNGAVEVISRLDATDLLRELLRIESVMGRVRGERNGPRPIDLDLLLFGDAILRLPGLEVPHPRLLERRFVLEPLAEIAPARVHPVTGRTLRAHLEELDLEPPDHERFNASRRATSRASRSDVGPAANGSERTAADRGERR